MLEQIAYKDARPLMQPGDHIAFGGKGNLSELIKRVSGGPVSHSAALLQSKLILPVGFSEPEASPLASSTCTRSVAQPGFLNQVIESTSLDGKIGVTISRLSDRLADYKGVVWWLPLSDAVRERMDLVAYYNWMLHQEGKKYDFKQAAQAGLDRFEGFLPFLHAEEDFSKFFCSELIAAGYEMSGVIRSLNCSEVTPLDLCRFSIYQPTYYQIVRNATEPFVRIPGFNTMDPEGWGE